MHFDIPICTVSHQCNAFKETNFIVIIIIDKRKVKLQGGALLEGYTFTLYI
jgi:hypothetical protein